MKAIKTIVCSTVFVAMLSCHATAPEETAAEATEVKTPVTVTYVQISMLTDSIELNANAAYLLNSYIKSNATGYVRAVMAKPGDYIERGKILFNIETKESTIIGKTISSLDSSFKFSGLNTIRAGSQGYITQVNHQPGDYVQDGEQLAVISDVNSFVFLLNMPYELRPYVMAQKNVTLSLPDGTQLTGNIFSALPTVDSVTQTQTIVIKVNSKRSIPQNLVARVRIVKSSKANAQTLPRTAVLSDESQSVFWVMKMMDSSTAVKVNVRKGLEFPDRIEILSPVFSKTDQILVTGNYGLPDTAKVTIEKP